MNTCASSCVNARTRIRPCSAPRRLEAVHLAEFRELERQIAIGLQAVLEDLHVPGAVHRLDRVDALVVVAMLREEHHLAILLHVAGGDPQRGIHELRRVDLDVAGRRSAGGGCSSRASGTASSLSDARTPSPAPPPGSGKGPSRGRASGGRASRLPRSAGDRRRAPPAWRRRCRRCATSISRLESPRQ